MKHFILFALLTSFYFQSIWADKSLDSNLGQFTNSDEDPTDASKDNRQKDFIIASAGLGGLAAVAVGGTLGGLAISHLVKHKQALKLYDEMNAKFKKLKPTKDQLSDPTSKKHTTALQFIAAMEDDAKATSGRRVTLKETIEDINSSKILSRKHTSALSRFHDHPIIKIYKDLVKAEKLR